jgi:hypothetical protein
MSTAKNDFVPNALRALKEGEDGLKQPRVLRGRLLSFEACGWVEYRKGGWFLTADGKQKMAEVAGK